MSPWYPHLYHRRGRDYLGVNRLRRASICRLIGRPRRSESKIWKWRVLTPRLWPFEWRRIDSALHFGVAQDQTNPLLWKIAVMPGERFVQSYTLRNVALSNYVLFHFTQDWLAESKSVRHVFLPGADFWSKAACARISATKSQMRWIGLGPRSYVRFSMIAMVSFYGVLPVIPQPRRNE